MFANAHNSREDVRADQTSRDASGIRRFHARHVPPSRHKRITTSPRLIQPVFKLDFIKLHCLKLKLYVCGYVLYLT